MIRPSSLTLLIAFAWALPVAGQGRTEKEWLALEEKALAAKGSGSPVNAGIRGELFQFRLKHPAAEQSIKAAGLLRDSMSPFDQLDATKIPALEYFKWFPKETVAVLGE